MKKQAASAWLYGPKADFLFLFGIPFFSICFFFVDSTFVKGLFGLSFFLMTILLSGGHNWGPLIYYVINPEERSRIRATYPKVDTFLLISFCVPLLLLGASIYFFAIGDHDTKIKIFLFNGLCYLVWNTYHFTQQQFGVLAILKSKAAESPGFDRWFDLILCHVLLSVLPMILCYSLGQRVDFLQIFTEKHQLPKLPMEVLKAPLLMIYAIAGVLILFKIIRGKFSVPVNLQYLSIFIQAFGMIIHPAFFISVVYGATHRLQEIYFISRLSQSKFRFPFICSVVLLLFVSLLVQSIYSSGPLKFHRILTYGGHVGMENISLGLYSTLALLNGALLGVNFAHFFIDRFIFKGRSWANQETQSPQIPTFLDLKKPSA